MDAITYVPPHKGLVLDQITKRFGSVVAVDRVSLSVDLYEFLAVIGPTGCGKTTLLRLIAGLEKLDDGHIYILGECVDDKKPVQRGIRMVFQDYALWPHMQVFNRDFYSNLSFSMKIRRTLPVNIQEKVHTIASRLGIGKHLFPRKPDELSAGQKQMVGIGRAMTIKPKILLLDEPLSNVDPQHRLSLRKELKDYHNRMGTISIYVSHNLPEAFSLADRVAIMKDGKIVQVDVPSKIRERPANAFVKGFLQCF
ncbi:MAG: ABC transporter ATP-binding protein, partial [Deltaproteobacteria bacterium]|nr:ABC transporter ATP-binding protein [Deltaproteobacteria bacterium]